MYRLGLYILPENKFYNLTIITMAWKWWQITHGFWSRRLSWENYKFYELYLWMKARCGNKKHCWYKNYWWRWIKCNWDTFEDFKNDMYESYVDHCNRYWKKDTLLDRIDNDKNYCKDNCRWATREEQNNNTRVSTKVVIDGKEYWIIEVKKLTWLGTDGARKRMKDYMLWIITKEQLLWKDRIRRKTSPLSITIDGKIITSSSLAEMCWIKKATAAQRIERYKKWIWTKNSLLHIWVDKNKFKF